MMNSRKRAVSLRLSTVDLKKIKRVSERLHVRESEFIRFAIKQMLARLSPLSDPSVRGRDLMPLFLEPGSDLVRHFDLDVERLAAIVNEGAEGTPAEVSANDLHMLAMSGAGVAPNNLSVPALAVSNGNGNGNGHEHAHRPGTGHAGNGDAHPAPGTMSMPPPPPGMVERRANPMRRYLYEKYLYGARD
jgi:hypothetical protein